MLPSLLFAEVRRSTTATTSFRLLGNTSAGLPSDRLPEFRKIGIRVLSHLSTIREKSGKTRITNRINDLANRYPTYPTYPRLFTYTHEVVVFDI